MTQDQIDYRNKYEIRAATKEEYKRMSEMQRGWYDSWKDIKFPLPKDMMGRTMPPILLFSDGEIMALGYHETVKGKVLAMLRPKQPE